MSSDFGELGVGIALLYCSEIWRFRLERAGGRDSATLLHVGINDTGINDAALDDLLLRDVAAGVGEPR